MAPRWLDWSPAAFQLAQSQDRCIVLFLTPFWSRWGRRMERDAWGDPDVGRLLEADYVGIRVDSDRRPDVADRYAPGSLPATAFLDPKGTMLYASGFLDASELKRLLIQFKVGYGTSKGKLDEAVRERDGLIRRVLKGRYPKPGTLDASVFARTLAGIRESVDPANGGFGLGPKSPLPSSLRVLLRGGEHDVLRKTLDAMLARALRDPADGSFFTGTLDARWTQPSLEKTPEGNAALARVLLEAGTELKEPRYADAGLRAVEWLAGLRGAPAPAEAGAPAEFDATALADRQALVASALLQAGDDARHRMARDLLDRVMAGFVRGALPHGPEGPSWLLRDRLAVGHALLDAGDTVRAAAIGDRLLADFWSEEERGLLDRKPGVDDLGELSRPVTHLAETSQGALLLIRLAGATGEKRFRSDAERLLAGQPDFTPDWGHYTADFALAVDALLRSA